MLLLVALQCWTRSVWSNRWGGDFRIRPFWKTANHGLRALGAKMLQIDMFPQWIESKACKFNQWFWRVASRGPGSYCGWGHHIGGGIGPGAGTIYIYLYPYRSSHTYMCFRTFTCIQFTLFAFIQIDLHALTWLTSTIIQTHLANQTVHTRNVHKVGYTLWILCLHVYKKSIIQSLAMWLWHTN